MAVPSLRGFALTYEPAGFRPLFADLQESSSTPNAEIQLRPPNGGRLDGFSVEETQQLYERYVETVHSKRRMFFQIYVPADALRGNEVVDPSVVLRDPNVPHVLVQVAESSRPTFEPEVTRSHDNYVGLREGLVDGFAVQVRARGVGEDELDRIVGSVRPLTG